MKLKGIILAISALSAGAAFAHHSFTATYDEAATIEIEGQLVQFMFRNPHAWVHVMAPDENGEIAQKTEETVGPYELHDFFLYHVVRNGFPPDKILAMAERALAGAGRW